MILSLRAYARHRKALGLTGGTLKAVQTAITSGRLDRSLTPDRKRIASAEQADAEWAATTHEDRIPLTGPGASASGAPAELPPDVPPAVVSRARREAALAGLAELELAERRGQLVAVDEIRAEVMARYSLVKTRLLGVPARARQRDATLTGPQVALIDSLIREALEELANEDIHTDEES